MPFSVLQERPCASVHRVSSLSRTIQIDSFGSQPATTKYSMSSIFLYTFDAPVMFPD